MSVEIIPIELGFRRPFTREVAETLSLRNPGSEPIAFKVKTTAPKQYCVRPNSGRIEGGEVVEVSVLLQPMKEEPPLEARCRDKFLVQSVAIAADQEVNNVATIWANIEQTAKSTIQERKIRVNFLPPSNSAAAGNVSTPVRSHQSRDELPPAYSSPAASTPQQHASSGAMSTPASHPDGGRNATTDSSVNGAQSTVGAMATSVASMIPTSADDVRAQLAEAQDTIKRLTAQAQDSVGLRQRKPDSGSQGTSSQSTSYGTQHSTPGGVPVPIVAALCLLSFLLAYLLF